MIDALIEMIREAQADVSTIREVAALGSQIEKFQDAEVEQLLDRMGEFQDELPQDPLLHHALQPVLAALVSRAKRKNTVISSSALGQISQLYKSTSPTSNLRNYLLAWLATSHQLECIQTWTSLICQDPPEHRSGIGIAFGPLMSRDIEPQDWMLQSLLADGVQYQQLAPAIYDLFNFYVREEIIELHPAAERAEELTSLLGMLVGKMGHIEEGSIDAQQDPQQISRQVADSVALIVALSDTLAIIQHVPASGKLHQALELKHRRVQAEAAAALVRLGDELGKQALIKLAEEPIVRLRILKYAEELNLLNEISLEFQGEIARAESHLAIWLAEPTQMGIAPSRLELVDNREMYWPSYEHPVQCYIFRFEYGSDNRQYSNLAISGPLVHAFSADLSPLSVDDVYALFAGWQTIHNEIYQMSTDRAQQAFAREWRRLNDDLARKDEYTDVEVQVVGSFFEKLALVAKCTYQNTKGTVIVDSDHVTFIGEGTPAAPIDFNLAFAIWRGRQLLATFNPA